MLFTTTNDGRRLSVALAALGLVTVCGAPSASAAPPDPLDVTYRFVLNPGDNDEDLTFGRLCSFDVAVEVEGKTKTIELPDDTFIFTSPGNTATVTNLATGETLTLEVPGSIRTTLDAEVVFRGANLIFRSTEFGDDENALLLTHGRFTFDPAATPKLTGVGETTDICAALA